MNEGVNECFRSIVPSALRVWEAGTLLYSIGAEISTTLLINDVFANLEVCTVPITLRNLY